jgi:iturin family lipopeptide synthetase C
MDYLTRIFQVVLFDVNLRLGNIDILTEDEKDRLMRFFNNTTADYPRDKSIHALFSEQAERAPGHTALLEAHNHRSLSYKKLNEKVDQLAQLLISRGVRAESNIGLLLNRSIELIIGILGILKIGCTYVPIDTGSPVGRIRFMLTDSNAALLLTEKQAKGKLSSINMNGQIFLDDDRLYQECDAGSVKTPDNLTNPAYIIYTSGTTGTPKGVVIRQRALVNYAWWASRVYIKNEKINFPLYTSISFDLTVTSIYPPLLTGNTIIIYGTSTGEFLIEKILRENRVDAVKLTPSHLKLLRNRRELTENSRVRRFIVGGEKLETQLAQDIHLTFNGKVEIYNEYGPTEATVGCMIYRYDPGIDQRESVPIGAPVANARIYLLNSRQRFVPPGAIGEIYISGDGVAREYWNRRELTQEKFIPDPFMPGGNMYKTGDLARQLPAGSLEFLGRMDEQINIRGFRVELGEIEKHLANHEHIRDAVVITRDDGRGNRQICAYVVQEGTTAAEINAYLSQYLPDYMIPAYFVFLNSIPLTANGKLDKKALPDPIEHMQNSTPYQAPGNDIEKKLAVIWQQELGIEKIGINDNFFNIGGDSIKSITLLNAINKAFNTNLKLVNLYQNETIAKFAVILEQEKTNDDNTIYQNTMHEFENMKDEFLKGLKK